MPTFDYSGMNKSGKKVRGVLDADSVRALRDVLKRKGIYLTDSVEGSRVKATRGQGLNREVDLKFFGNRVKGEDIAMLTRQLATLQRSGIPLIESLNAIVEQLEKETLKHAMSDVRTRVNEGSSLANALKEHPKLFTGLYVNMVRAGESAGNLDVVLERLTDFLEAQNDLKGKVMSAMYYPIIMSVLGVGVMSFLFIYVIPKVTQIFEGQGQTLPFITRVLIGFTTFISNPVHIVIIVIVVVGGVVFFRRWKRTEEGRYKWDVILLKLPVLGPTLRMIAISRFAGTLSTLLNAGVPLLGAMAIVKDILGNQRLVEVIEDVRTNVREGESIAGPLKRSGEFDPIVTHMIAIGERSGQLENMLDNISVAYEKQIDNRLRALTSLLEPAMIVVMGVVVGFIVFAILVPILNIGKGIQ